MEGGKVSIRTRALGSSNPSIQVPDASKNLGGIFTDYAVKVAGAAVQLRQRTNAANDDPKSVRTAANIKYTLDPVDDLVAGTYMINVEFAERGNNTSAVPGSYRTPSIAVATFQVKQAAVEKPIADGCTSCHWSTSTVGAGVGFVLDPIRHNKPFNAQAVDQCGGCHNYKSGETVSRPHLDHRRRHQAYLEEGARGPHGCVAQLPDTHGRSRGERCRTRLADHLPDGDPQLRVLPFGRDQRHMEDQPQSCCLYGVSRLRRGHGSHADSGLGSDSDRSLERRREGKLRSVPLVQRVC